jgi:hypothetical protein
MTALREFASAAAAAIYDAINVAETPDQLDQLARTMWRGYTEGAIGDDDAALLQSCIDRRRPSPRNTPRTAPGQAMGKLADRLGVRASRFKPRQQPRSPDRKASRNRRRMLGASAVMPPNLRQHYTQGQMAVLAIIAGEIKHHGICDLPLDKIAALAGVCRTTVQTTLHEARRRFHIVVTERPQPGRKSLTNVVEIISPEWSTWIKRGPTAHRPIGSNFAKMASPTKNTCSKQGGALPAERPQRAGEACRGLGRGHYQRGECWYDTRTRDIRETSCSLFETARQKAQDLHAARLDAGFVKSRSAR